MERFTLDSFKTLIREYAQATQNDYIKKKNGAKNARFTHASLQFSVPITDENKKYFNCFEVFYIAGEGVEKHGLDKFVEQYSTVLIDYFSKRHGITIGQDGVQFSAPNPPYRRFEDPISFEDLSFMAKYDHETLAFKNTEYVINQYGLSEDNPTVSL